MNWTHAIFGVFAGAALGLVLFLQGWDDVLPEAAIIPASAALCGLLAGLWGDRFWERLARLWWWT